MCDRTDPHRALDTVRPLPWVASEDLSVRPAFTCRLGHGEQARLVVMAERTGWIDSVLVFRPASSARPVQVLRLDEGEPPPLGADFLQGADLNLDGWTDVRLGRFWGATGNHIVDVFMYDPARGGFTRDTVLSEASNVQPLPGRPCVRTSSVFGMAGMDHSRAHYCWTAGRWTLTWSEDQDEIPSPRRGKEFLFARTTRRRLPGGRYRTRVDTLTSSQAEHQGPEP